MGSPEGYSDLFLRETRDEDPHPSTKPNFATGIISVHPPMDGYMESGTSNKNKGSVDA